MAPLPGLPGWAGTRKVKPVWISQKQETVSGSGISWAICKSAPRSCQHPITEFFTDRMPFLPPNQQRQSTERRRAMLWNIQEAAPAMLQMPRFFVFFATHCVLNLQFCLILLSAICLFVCWAVSSILLLNLCQVNLCTFEACVYVCFCACLGWSQHNDWRGSGWRYWWLRWNGWYYGHSVYIINSLIVNLYWFLTWLERCHSRLYWLL